jgi:uncharacterized membrane protein YbhN (UPF0104 family)
LRTLLALLITLLFLLLFFLTVSPQDLVADLGRFSLSELLLSFLFYSLSQLVRALRWWLVLKTVPLRHVLLINSANVFLNNLLPARTGEVSWFYYCRRAGVSLPRSLWSFFLARLFDLMGMVALLLITFLALRRPDLLLPGAVLLVAVPLLLPEAGRVLPGGGRLGELKSFLRENFTLFLSLGMFALSLLALFFKFISVYLITSELWGMGPLRSLMAFAGGELTTVLPLHGIGGYGTYEAGFLIPLKMVGVELETALKAGLVAHSFLLVSSALWGLPSIVFLHTLYRRSP